MPEYKSNTAPKVLESKLAYDVWQEKGPFTSNSKKKKIPISPSQKSILVSGQHSISVQIISKVTGHKIKSNHSKVIAFPWKMKLGQDETDLVEVKLKSQGETHWSYPNSKAH